MNNEQTAAIQAVTRMAAEINHHRQIISKRVYAGGIVAGRRAMVETSMHSVETAIDELARRQWRKEQSA